MSEAAGKGRIALAAEFLKRPSLVVMAFGVVFVLVAVTTGVSVKDIHVEAQSDYWRTVSAGFGLLLFLTGVVLAIRETRTARRVIPGPFSDPPGFPVTVYQAPPDRFTVTQPKQSYRVVFASGKPLPPTYSLQLMHVSNKQHWLHAPEAEFRQVGLADFRWEFVVQAPSLDDLRTGETTRHVAAFYVGPLGQMVFDHHRHICRLLATDGKKWPPLLALPDDVIRCSRLVSVTFDLPQSYPMPDGAGPRSGTGLPDSSRPRSGDGFVTGNRLPGGTVGNPRPGP